ncbi:MAG: methyl-accepting chemotaxis protein [Candidatus Methylomirabilales bacterium]
MERKRLWRPVRTPLERFSDLGVATRLGLLVAVLSLAYLLLTGYVIVSYGRSLARTQERYDFILQAADLARTAQVDFTTQVQEWKNVLQRASDPALRERHAAGLRKEAREVQANLAELKERMQAAGLRGERVEQLLAAHKAISERYVKEEEALDARDPGAARRLDAAVGDGDRLLADELDVVVFELLSLTRQHQESLEREQTALRLRVLLLLALVTAAAVAVGLAFSRSITRPLAQTVKVLDAVAAGDLTRQLERHTRDELGQLARTLNQTIVRLRGQVRTEAERDEERRAREELQANIARFLNVATDIAQGDLTKRGEVTADVLGNVVDAINVMVDEIATILRGVRDATLRVAASSAEMSQSTEQMVAGVQAQTRDAVAVSSTMEEMAVSVRQVAENADASARSAKQALEAVERGETAVRNALAAMQQIRGDVQAISKRIKSLGDRSLEISDIVNTIEEIASQTNLLALNAAIEAAGAGEAGLRFAVVADEVRKLAERAAKATKDIAALIKNVQAETHEAVVAMAEGTAKVEAGYQVTAQAEASLREIGTISRKSAELAADIRLATQQQVHGAEGVAGSIQAIASVATQTEQGAVQTQQTARALGEVAEALSASLARFRLAS